MSTDSSAAAVIELLQNRKGLRSPWRTEPLLPDKSQLAGRKRRRIPEKGRVTGTGESVAYGDTVCFQRN